MRKFLWFGLFFIFIFVLIPAGVIGYLAFSTSGSRILLERVLSHFVEFEQEKRGVADGNLVSGFTLENSEFSNIEGLPAESTLRIQRLFIRIKSLAVDGITVELSNARLRLKQSDPIVVEGNFKNSRLNVNVFGPSLGINEIKEFIFTAGWMRKISGHFKDFDIYVKGPYNDPDIRGEVFVETFERDKITLLNVPIRFSIDFPEKGDKKDFTGYIFAKEGELQSRKTVVKLKESRINFEHDVENPQLNLRGQSIIEGVIINIRITGTKLKPDIQLTSQPPLPYEGLLVMLATGKRWEGVEGALSTGTLSTEVAADFLDFFFFSGKGQTVGSRLGIKDIDFTFTPDTQGIGVTKSVTKKLDVGYGVEKKSDSVEQSSSTTQRVGGEYHLTDKFSLELEKKTETQDETTNTLESEVNKVESEDKVMLKFETKF